MIQDLLQKINDLECYIVLAIYAVSCMDKAKYQTENIGHFPLASRCYTHFTSPIRRYPDLTVHRLLRAYCFNENLTNDTIDYYQKELDDISSTSNERELAARDCEMESDKMFNAEYMETQIGKIYSGYISGLSKSGMYVMLPNLIEGMIRFSLEYGRFEYHPDEEIVVENETKRVYTIGSKIQVKVISANKLQREIDFAIFNGEKKEVGYNEKKKKAYEKKG